MFDFANPVREECNSRTAKCAESLHIPVGNGTAAGRLCKTHRHEYAHVPPPQPTDLVNSELVVVVCLRAANISADS